MVLNIFKTLASKSSDPQPRSSSRLGSDNQLRYGGSSTSTPSTNTGGGSRLASCTLSAPSSPSLVKSAIPSLVKRPSSMASNRHPPPPANICVEKGRIEFVKSPVVTTTAVRPQSPPQASSLPSSIPSAAKMGTKIFRPNAAAVRKSPEGSVSSKLPPVSNRESKIPVVSRAGTTAVAPKPPDVVMRIPRTMPVPPSVTRSRETSPAGEGIPVSPNLIRWRAKLSSSSNSSSPSCVATAKTKAPATQQQQQQQQQQEQVKVPEGLVVSSKPSAPADNKKTDTAAASEPNQMQLLNLHYEVKRLEETVQTLLPLRHQQTALIQSYEERLAESQSRLATAEAEVARLKERLGRVENSEADHRQLVQQLETDKAAMASGQEQQRQVFDKCLDEIANHVFQALISQKNLQGECRRLRSQVSDLEQRNVALNLLLTQSLRDSMQLETGSRKLSGATIPCCAGEMTKSHSYDCGVPEGAGNQRDSVCSTVSDSELTQRNCSSILAAVDWANCGSSKGRLLVSKDSNWTLASTATVASSSSSSTSSHSSSQTALMAVTGTGDLQSPVERAEKLLAVLKHRLFSAQLNCGFTGHEQTDSAPETPSAPPVTPVPSTRPNSLALDQATVAVKTMTMTTTTNKKSDSPCATTPSVRALVEKMEAKRTASSPATVLAVSPPRPPLPAAAIAAVAAIRSSPATANCPSKDEGYSTLSSDVQVDSSSSSSSFIASGCSSPATLRRSGSTGSNPSRRSSGSSPSVVTTRSLPMLNKRKTVQPMRPPPQVPQLQVNRCQENTAAAAALDQLREEEDETPLPSTGQKRHQANEWAVGAVAGVELGTLCEDWSAGECNTTGSDEGETQTSHHHQQLEGSKWTSDSDLFKEEEEWKPLGNDGQEGHPLRRSRAHVHLSSSDAVVVVGVTNNIDASPAAAPSSSSTTGSPHYSERELEDWILHSSSEEMLLQQQNDATLSAISENSYESDQDDDDEDDDRQLFMPGPSSSDEAADNEEEEETEDEEEEEENVDTEFTPDYYRLVKFESNPSLANSERGEPRPAADDVVPPDRQVALQTVLDFIAEQQRYCAQRQSQDEVVAPQRRIIVGLNSSTPPSQPSSSSSLLQLRQFAITDDDDVERLDSDQEDGSFSTTWMPVRGQAVLDSLLRSSSSSSSSSCSRCCSPSPQSEETRQGGKL